MSSSLSGISSLLGLSSLMIHQALADIKSGKMVIITDDEHRENEGDLVLAAEHITPEKMAFMIRYTGGVVVMPMSNAQADKLDLPHMVPANTSARGTAFTVSIDAARGVTSGISAADRATTVQTAVNVNSSPNDFVRPGHVFPLRAQDGGVLWRAGHTEASVDLCKLSGLKPIAVISELMNDDGTMMRGLHLAEFAQRHDLAIISIADIIAHRRAHDTETEAPR